MDAKQELRDKVGNAIDGVELFGVRTLVAIYKSPEKTAGGIIKPDSLRQEDVYQGKVGLILKNGPLAFTDPNFVASKAEEGTWVWFRASNGLHLQLNKVDCRILEDINILGKVDSPDMIW